MRPLQAWFTWVLIGVLVGAAAGYFGYAAWLAAIGAAAIASVNRPRWVSLSGCLAGVAAGMAVILAIGSSCPPQTHCQATFSLIPYGVFIAIGLIGGIMCALVFLLSTRIA